MLCQPINWFWSEKFFTLLYTLYQTKLISYLLISTINLCEASKQASMQSEPCSVGACLTLNSHNLAKLCPFVKPWSKSKSKPLSQQTPKLNKRIWLEGFGLRAGTKIILATTTTTYPTPNFLCMKECSGGYKTPLSSIGIFLYCNSCHQWNSFVEELFKCTGWLLKMPKTIWAWERIILSYF